MKAALLIDWENVRNALNEQGYHCHASGAIAKGLLECARDRAADRGLSFDHAAIFIPPIALSEAERQELVNEGVEVVFTPEGPQAADMALSATVFRLLNDGYSLFFIAANDAGFVQTAHQVERSHGNCWLWAVSPRRVRPEVRAWHLTEYLIEAPSPGDSLLPWLTPCPPPPADDVRLFVLACQQLAARGFALWSYPRALPELRKLDYLGSEAYVKTLWNQANSRGYFRSDPTVVDGRDTPRRRLAYENRDISRLLTICDAALAAVGQRPAGMSREAAFGVLAHPLCEGPKEAAALFGLLVKAGYFYDGELVTLTREQLRFGTLSALRRIGLIAWDRTVQLNSDAISMTKIAERWPNHVARRARGQHFHTLRQQGNEFVKMAKVAGLLVEQQTQQGVRYRIRESHPLVRDVKTVVSAAVALLDRLAAGDTSVHQDQVLAMLAQDKRFGHTPAENWSALSMLASEELVTWHDYHVRLRRSAPLVHDVMSRAANV